MKILFQVYCGNTWHYGADATIHQMNYGPLLNFQQGKVDIKIRLYQHTGEFG